MIQNYSRYRLLQEFFDVPRKSLRMRELSRKIGLAQPSVLNHLKALCKEGLITREEGGLYPTYRANLNAPLFKLLKEQNLVWRLHATKLLEYLDETVKPNCVVLFGSGARGEDHAESDIDLFIQAEERPLELKRFEAALHRKFHLLFEADIRTLPKELLNNLINGQVLYGYLE